MSGVEDRVQSSGPASAEGSHDDDGPTVITRKRLVIAAILIVIALVGLYFLIPKLAGLKQTWGQLKHGDPVWLAIGAVFEIFSVAGYAVLFGTVFGRGVPRIDWRASLEIPLAGIAAIRLVAAAGAGGVAVTAWALGRAGLSAEVIACRMVASLVIQYSVYLAALFVCGLGLWAGLFPGGGSSLITLIPALLALGLVVVILSLALMPRDIEHRLDRFARRTGRLGRLAQRAAKAPETLGSGVRTAGELIAQRRLGLLGAVAYWGFDIAVLGVCFHAFGANVALSVLIVGYFLGTLGSLLPLPAGIGGVEGGMIGAFVAFGAHASTAIIAVLAYRAISFWLPTLPGIVGYVALRSTVRRWREQDA
ncbi:MAG TPA: lysylphosphatidylglycerol synthase transmembrane domain-containing protein [Solirubrobacteraceae bacterium]|nr:lysylphosphatidylglycerol synthase transmembrane domain-containing protein [Solirubrobacteraceae bacterium]